MVISLWPPLLARPVYTVSKNDSDVAHCNFNEDQPISVIFDRTVAERVCYAIFPPHLTN